MAQLRLLRYNFISLAAAEGIAKIIGAALYVVLARYLGPERFGIYSLAISFGIIFGLLANLGLDPVIIRDVARNPKVSGSYFSHSVLLKLAAGSLCFFTVLLVTFLLGYESEVRTAVLIFSCVVFVVPLNAAQQSIFKAHQRMEYAALMNALRPALNLTLVLVAVAMGLGVRPIVGIHTLGALILFVVFYFFVLKRYFCHFFIPENAVFFLPLLKSATPFVFIGILYILNTKIDILIISKLVGVEATGLYSAANELTMMLFVIPTLFSTVLFPAFSRDYGQSNMSHLAKSGGFAVKFLNVIGIPSGLGFFLLAPEIIQLVYGNEYLGSVIVVRILSVAVCFFFAKSVLSWMLTAIDEVKVLMKINLTALGVNITLDLLLVPVFSYPAAAIGTVMSILISYFLVSFFLTRKLEGMIIFKTFVKPIVACVFMAVALILSKDLPLFPKIGIGIASYSLSGIIISVFNKEERAVLRQILAMV